MFPRSLLKHPGQSMVYNPVYNREWLNAEGQRIQDATKVLDVISGQTHVYTGSGANKWISAHTGTVIDSTLLPGPSYHQLETPARP